MTKKKNEGDLTVNITFCRQDGEIYNYLEKLPSRSIRNWEIKKLAITHFETQSQPLSDPLPSIKQNTKSSNAEKSSIQDF